MMGDSGPGFGFYSDLPPDPDGQAGPFLRQIMGDDSYEAQRNRQIAEAEAAELRVVHAKTVATIYAWRGSLVVYLLLVAAVVATAVSIPLTVYLWRFLL